MRPECFAKQPCSCNCGRLRGVSAIGSRHPDCVGMRKMDVDEDFTEASRSFEIELAAEAIRRQNGTRGSRADSRAEAKSQFDLVTDGVVASWFSSALDLPAGMMSTAVMASLHRTSFSDFCEENEIKGMGVNPFRAVMRKVIDASGAWKLHRDVLSWIEDCGGAVVFLKQVVQASPKCRKRKAEDGAGKG